MFIRGLKFIAIPLVLFSIIVGVASLKDITKLGRVGAKTLGAYLLTTIIAVSVGLIMVNVVNPGSTISKEQKIKNRIGYELWVKSQHGIAFKDELRYSEDPKYQELVMEIQGDSIIVDEKITNLQQTVADKKAAGPLDAIVNMIPDNLITAMENPKLMLQVIFFAIFFGISMLFIPESKSTPVIKVFDGINEVFLKMVDLIMRAAPFFVFALMAGVMSKMASTLDELRDMLLSLGVYSLVVVGGLLLVLLLYPLLVSIFVKRIRYMDFWRKISPAQLTAFSTSSSAATLPITMECVEEGVGVKNEIASFVLPIGATVNMDGTSLYQAIAVIFIAQIHLIDLSLGEQAVIVMTATLASIGSAAVPSGGLVMLMMVLMVVMTRARTMRMVTTVVTTMQ